MKQYLFHAISADLIGPRATCMRATVFYKMPGTEEEIGWHQDVSEDWGMSKIPRITIWTALDPATKENGCLQVVSGSHKKGRIGNGHYLSPEEIKKNIKRPEHVELEAGHSIVMDAALLHKSGINKTKKPRRGFTFTLLEADTKNTKTNKTYPVIFGKGELTGKEKPWSANETRSKGGMM